MTKQEFITEIKMTIASDLDKAIKDLLIFTKGTDYFNDMIMQSGRFNGIQKRFFEGTVTESNASIEQNRIRQALLFITDKIEKDSEFIGNVPKNKIPKIEGQISGNSINVDGDGNINLQDINGQNINITINKG